MKKSVIGGTALAILLCIINLPLVPVLSISNRKNPSERVYSTKAFTNGFAIGYTHSVNKGRVKDFYQVHEGRQLMLYKTVFVSYGAGIPEPSETEGAVFRVEADGYTIDGVNRLLPSLVMAVGVIADHSIIVGTNEFFLKDFFKPQTSLKFEVRRFSLVRLFSTKKLGE